MPSLTIAFCYDLKTDYIAQGIQVGDCTEFDEEETIDAITKTLESIGHSVIQVGNIKSLVGCLARGEEQGWDLVFNITEGLYGGAREAQVPALLEAWQIPFTFSASATLSLCLDKAATKVVLQRFGIPTAPFTVVANPKHTLIASTKNRGTTAVETSPDATQLTFPLFAKPIAEGSSKGVLPSSKANNAAELDAVIDVLCASFPGQDILIEKFLHGREFTIGLVGTGSEARVIGVLELRGKQANNYLTHTTKNVMEDYVNNIEEVAVNAEDDSEVKAACDIALKAWRILGCRDAGRIDMRSNIIGEGAMPQFMEVNPLSGLRPNYSLLPILSQSFGISYSNLLREIVESASERICKNK